MPTPSKKELKALNEIANKSTISAGALSRLDHSRC